MLKITINEKEYSVLFGYGAFRLLGQKWNCTGIQEVFGKVSSFFTSTTTDFSFEKQEALADLVLSGIKNAKPNSEISLTVDDVAESFLHYPEQIQEVVTAFMNSLPKAKPQPEKK